MFDVAGKSLAPSLMSTRLLCTRQGAPPVGQGGDRHGERGKHGEHGEHCEHGKCGKCGEHGEYGEHGKHGQPSAVAD